MRTTDAEAIGIVAIGWKTNVASAVITDTGAVCAWMTYSTQKQMPRTTGGAGTTYSTTRAATALVITGAGATYSTTGAVWCTPLSKKDRRKRNQDCWQGKTLHVSPVPQRSTQQYTKKKCGDFANLPAGATQVVLELEGPIFDPKVRWHRHHHAKWRSHCPSRIAEDLHCVHARLWLGLEKASSSCLLGVFHRPRSRQREQVSHMWRRICRDQRQKSHVPATSIPLLVGRCHLVHAALEGRRPTGATCSVTGAGAAWVHWNWHHMPDGWSRRCVGHSRSWINILDRWSWRNVGQGGKSNVIDYGNQSCAAHGRRWSDELVHGSRMKVLHIPEYWSRRNVGHGWRRSTDFVLHCVGHGGSRSILVVHGACAAQVTAGAGIRQGLTPHTRWLVWRFVVFMHHLHGVFHNLWDGTIDDLHHEAFLDHLSILFLKKWHRKFKELLDAASWPGRQPNHQRNAQTKRQNHKFVSDYRSRKPSSSSVLINQHPVQFHWHQPHPKTTTTSCELALLTAVFFVFYVSRAKWGIRPVTCYVLRATDWMLRAVTDLQHATSSVDWSLYHMFVLTDYWTPETPTRTVNFVCFGLRYLAYWLLRPSCFFSFILQQHNHLLFQFFHIYWRSLCGHHQPDRVLIESLRCFFVRGSRWALVGLRSVMVSGSENWPHLQDSRNDLPLLLDPQNSSRAGNLPSNIQKRNWNIRSSVTSASFAQNAERQEVIETFICMFRHIRSFKNKNLNSLSAFLFLLSYCLRTLSFPDEDWFRHHSSSGALASSHNENSEVDCPRDKKQLNKCSELQAKWRRSASLPAYQTYDIQDHWWRASVHRYWYTMSNDVAKSIILFSLHVISKTMKFQNAFFLLLLASLYLKKSRCSKSKCARSCSYGLENISEGRRSRSYTCLNLTESLLNVTNTFSALTFSSTNLRHMGLYWFLSERFRW